MGGSEFVYQLSNYEPVKKECLMQLVKPLQIILHVLKGTHHTSDSLIFYFSYFCYVYNNPLEYFDDYTTSDHYCDFNWFNPVKRQPIKSQISLVIKKHTLYPHKEV
jgi:hypothetical protein